MKKAFAIGALIAGATYGSAATIILNPTADDRLLSISATANDNGEFLSTFNGISGGVPNNQNTIIQFDYSSLVGQTVTSATLRLFG